MRERAGWRSGRALFALLEAAHEGGYGLAETDAPYDGDSGHEEHHGHQEHHGHEPVVPSTVRSVLHHGREIRIETTYKVTIDGEPLEGMLEVLDNGLVYYHGLPQHALPSAVDTLRQVIDHFWLEPTVEDEPVASGNLTVA